MRPCSPSEHASQTSDAPTLQTWQNFAGDLQPSGLRRARPDRRGSQDGAGATFSKTAATAVLSGERVSGG
jgi:hypothetical protein